MLAQHLSRYYSCLLACCCCYTRSLHSCFYHCLCQSLPLFLLTIHFSLFVAGTACVTAGTACVTAGTACVTAAAFDCTLIQASQKAMLKKRATLNKFTSTAKAEAVAKDLRGRGSPARRVRAGWRRITRHQPNPHAKKVVRASLLTVFKQCLSKCWCSGHTRQKVCHAEVFPENVQSQGQPLRQPLCQPLSRVHLARRIPGLLYRDLEKSNNRTIHC